MPQPVEPRLLEVLQAVKNHPRTLEEIAKTLDAQKKPVINVDTSWIHRKVVSKLLPKNDESSQLEKDLRQLRQDLQRLVQRELIKKDLTRYLDKPLKKDTEIFWLTTPRAEES